MVNPINRMPQRDRLTPHTGSSLWVSRGELLVQPQEINNYDQLLRSMKPLLGSPGVAVEMIFLQTQDLLRKQLRMSSTLKKM